MNKYFITKPYLATPNLNDSIGEKAFAKLSDAVSYLNNTTGMSMADEDWKMIGKIKRLKNVWYSSKEDCMNFYYGTWNGFKYI